jgi:hypothetical protein
MAFTLYNPVYFIDDNKTIINIKWIPFLSHNIFNPTCRLPTSKTRKNHK